MPKVSVEGSVFPALEQEVKSTPHTKRGKSNVSSAKNEEKMQKS